MEMVRASFEAHATSARRAIVGAGRFAPTAKPGATVLLLEASAIGATPPGPAAEAVAAWPASGSSSAA